MEKRKRIDWIDCAKGLGMLFVIIGHTGISDFSAILYAFHMPLFFFLSGYLFNGNMQFSEYLRRKVKGLVIPYFSLGTVLVVWYILRRIILFHVYDVKVYVELFTDMLIQKRFLSIWFIAALFVTSMIAYCIFQLTKQRNIPPIIFVLVGGLGLWYIRAQLPQLPWNADLAVAALFWYGLGVLVRQKNWVNTILGLSHSYKAIILLVAGGSTLALPMYNLYKTGESFDLVKGTFGIMPLALLTSLTGIVATILISNWLKESRVLKYIGNNSICYLALHQSIFITVMMEMSETFGILNKDVIVIRMVRAGAVVIVTVAMNTLVTWALTKSKFKWMIGK